MKYDVGQWVNTKEVGYVRIGKVNKEGQIVEVQKYEIGQEEPIFIRVEDLANKTLTVLSFLQNLIALIKGFLKSILK